MKNQLVVNVWDWIVAKDGRTVQITHDDMQDLKYEDIERHATIEEIIKAGGKPEHSQYALKSMASKPFTPPNEGGEDYKKYFNHIRGQLAWIPLEDEHIKAQVEGTLKSVSELESALAVRVPSSPVMSFEEFCREHHNCLPEYLSENDKSHAETNYKYYLIGTRSIVPEISRDEINKITKAANLKWGYSEEAVEEGVIKCLQWLRSQINK